MRDTDDGSTGRDGGGDPAGAGAETDEEGGCPKCGRVDVETATVAATGGGLSALMDVQNQYFSVVTCRTCDYTEFYGGRREERYVDLFLGREWVPPAERETAAKKADGPVHYCGSCGATVDAETTACPGCGRTFE